MIASTPMKVCAKPEPGIETNGELKPVAIAFASIVLPVPGAPRKSSPRSRLPPARSNASPDCQSVTTRRTSSFASTWPRTSLELDAPLRVAGLEAADLRDAHQQHRAHEDREVGDEEEGDEDDLREHRRVRERRQEPVRSMSPTVPHHVPPRISQTTVITVPNTIANRAFFRQYHARRRPITSSSRSCWLSAPKRLGHGIRRRKSRSAKPRKTITTPRVASERPERAPAVVLLEPDEERRARQQRDGGRGARQAAPLVGELGRRGSLRGATSRRVAAPQWPFSDYWDPTRLVC